LVPGALIAGKFRVERVVGRGGMGLVVDATNTTLGQRVALKFLATDAKDAAVRERFAREARAAVKLRSEHVARVYDVGDDPELGPFIVMELLVGSSLAEVLATTGRLPASRAAEYVIDACGGLSEAHARGIVHQDVKPANLFVTTGNDGRAIVKVLDFGIANVVHESAKSKSVGSPHYLAPEQLLAAGTVDHRTDVWALGCVLFELLTGGKAFSAPHFPALVAKILDAARAPVPDGVDVPAPLLDIVGKCLTVDRQNRFSSVAELAVALLPFARKRSHGVVLGAVTRARSSGLDPNLTMPSSMPPPPSEPGVDIGAAGALRPRPLPVIASPALDSTPPSRTSRPSSLAPPEPTPLPVARTRARARWLWPAVVAVILLAVGVAAFWRRSGDDGARVASAATIPPSGGATPVAAAPSAEASASGPAGALAVPSDAASPRPAIATTPTSTPARLPAAMPSVRPAAADAGAPAASTPAGRPLDIVRSR